MVLDKHVGFIGAGQMAEALARGFSDKGIVPADHMHCTDISKARRDLFQEMGAHAYEKAVQVNALNEPPDEDSEVIRASLSVLDII